MATPSEFAAFTPEQARAIWQIVQKAMAADSMRNTRKTTPIDEPSPHRVRYKNDSGEEIPSFACMQVIGTVQENNRTFVLVDKPSDICGEYLFNSPYPVEADGYGWGYAFGQVRMRGTASSYEACKRYAPESDSWDVAEGPGPFIVYGIDDVLDNVVRGRIIGDHCKARWILFDYAPGPVTLTDFYDGADPSECGEINVVYPLGEPCEGELVMAFHDPNTGNYVAVSTESALLGPPVTSDIVIDVGGQSCGLSLTTGNFKVFPSSCEGIAPIVSDVNLGADVPVMLAASSDECGTINYAWQSIRAFLCDAEGEPTGPSFTSFQINFDGVYFVSGAEFGERECPGNATWTWNYISMDWDLTTPCTNGCESSPPEAPPTNVSEEIQTRPCGAPAGESGCGLNLTLSPLSQACDPPSGGPTVQIVHVPLVLQSLVVVTDTYQDEVTNQIIVEKSTIYVCSYEGADPTEIEVDPCEGGSSGGS